jgi:molybdopterin/thiamine biosynthesis adenylyltransferase
MKKNYSFRISEQDYTRCRTAVLKTLPKESAVFLLAGSKTLAASEELIVRRIVEVPQSEYRIQENSHLNISPRAINGLISLCEQNNLGVILCHSHPTDSPYSTSDNHGEKRIAESIWKNVPNAPPVGSLLISPNEVRARIWTRSAGHRPVSSVSIIGRHNTKLLLGASHRHTSNVSDIYDRQILAFGSAGQNIISRTKVAIVGLGGTGSPIAEQLVRMGVEDFIIIDPDVLDPSNITRIYGSFFADAYRRFFRAYWPRKKKIPKVDLIARHLKSINPGVKVQTFRGSVVETAVANSLLDRDVIFCCTDEHWGRSVVNQVCYQYFIPVIDMGVRIDAKNDKIRGAFGSVHILRPDKPCLWCYEFLDAERIMLEGLPSQERKNRLREGYAQDIDSAAPSVISLTSTVASHAATAFLQLITDFMGSAGDIARLNYYIMEGTVNRGHSAIKDNCICTKIRGCGDLKTLPTINE